MSDCRIILIAVGLLYTIELFSQEPRKCLVKQGSTKQWNASRKATADNGQVVYISVVVHVVYNSPDQNISDEQIRSQIKGLNEDFNRQNADSIYTLEIFKPIAANAKIIFLLASKDKDGNLTSGVTRSQTNHGPFINDDIHFASLGGVDGWPSTRFLNIWVCHLADGVFGYGTPPGTDSNTDGIVVDYRYFGTMNTVTPPFDKGRTATHEVGHWLGLKHLWGNAGGCIDDDGVADTPMQAGPSSGCDLSKVSCGNLNMTQNYMDFSDDACMNLFTKGQTDLMRINLFGHRAGVIAEVVTEIQLKFRLLKIYDGIYQIESQSPIYKLMVMDLNGREVCFMDFSNNQLNTANFDLKNKTGIFFVWVGTRDAVFTERIIN